MPVASVTTIYFLTIRRSINVKDDRESYNYKPDIQY